MGHWGLSCCSSTELYLNSSSSKVWVFLWINHFFLCKTEACNLYNGVCDTLVETLHKANNQGPAGFSVDNCRVVPFLPTGFSTTPGWTGVQGADGKKPVAASCDGFGGAGEQQALPVCLPQLFQGAAVGAGACGCCMPLPP